MIAAVIFDCDGVLVDSEAVYHEVELAVLAEMGLPYDRHDFKARFMGMSDKAFHAALEADALERLGRSITVDLKSQFRERFAAASERLAAVPGAAAAVDAVRLPKAVASSSTTAALEFKLKLSGLWERFVPHVYSAEHVTHSKPAPDLFLYAASALGIAPAECLVIEDSVNGVRAGLAAGMRVWGFMGGGHMDEPARARLLDAGVERIVENWSKAAPLLAAL
ncbi:MAG TPA: HAD-IA family hydrolase [Rhizomicrobium sp.]|jgi:HAD superfamily hydrolase (TIGR01509 family)|nr:HAD-IA family hydrolase [Rhizomicrobium sp.]